MKIRSNIFISVFAVLAVLSGTAGFVAGRYFSDNRRPNFSNDYVLHVYPEMTAQDVMDSLVAGAGVLRPKSLERTFRKMEVEQNLKPGRYVVDKSSTSIYVSRRSRSGTLPTWLKWWIWTLWPHSAPAL